MNKILDMENASYFSQNSSLKECNESVNYIPKNYNPSMSNVEATS
jgi:hypothetical protein